MTPRWEKGQWEEVSRKMQLSTMDVWPELRLPAVPVPEVPPRTPESVPWGHWRGGGALDLPGDGKD